MKKTKSGQNHFWYYEAMAIIPTYIKIDEAQSHDSPHLPKYMRKLFCKNS